MMEHPVSIVIVSNSLMNLHDELPLSDALHFIFHPLQEVFRNYRLTYAAKLKCLEDLELAYVEMVEGTNDNGWWTLLELPLDIRHVSPRDISWKILDVRRSFSERSKDIITVSVPALTTLEWC
jgi:hypothetical protein